MTVNPVNDPPVLGYIQENIMFDEDSSIDIPLNVQDVDGDSLYFDVLGGNQIFSQISYEMVDNELSYTLTFLAEENLATYGIIIASFFPGIAYTMILYITGLTGVNREMIEAGRIDGASGFTMLWHVVFPQLKPATLISVVVTIVGSLRSFDLIAVMTAGGPWGSSEVLAYKMYQESLFNYRMGYGAAIATILFLIMDIYIAWFLYRLFKNERSEK